MDDCMDIPRTREVSSMILVPQGWKSKLRMDLAKGRQKSYLNGLKITVLRFFHYIETSSVPVGGGKVVIAEMLLLQKWCCCGSVVIAKVFSVWKLLVLLWKETAVVVERVVILKSVVITIGVVQSLPMPVCLAARG